MLPSKQRDLPSGFNTRIICDSAPPISSKNRSEEHTSELQSHLNLVCRLLLEKKKNQPKLNSLSNLICYHMIKKQKKKHLIKSASNRIPTHEKDTHIVTEKYRAVRMQLTEMST